MTDQDSDDKSDDLTDVIGFPFSRVRMSGQSDVVDLGLTPLSEPFANSGKSPKGHWCGRCRGIWYSYFLEAECPKCGNRHG